MNTILTLGLGNTSGFLLTLGYSSGVAASYEKARVTGSTSLAASCSGVLSLAGAVSGEDALV